MDPQTPYTALPLERFFEQLKAAGFHIDTGRKLRLLRLLHQKGARHIGNLQELKFTLAPFIAASATEQQRFYDFLDAYLADTALQEELWWPDEPATTARAQGPNPPSKDATLRPDGKKPSKLRLLAYAAGIIALLAGAYLVYNYLQPPQVTLQIQAGELEFSPLLREGQSHRFEATPLSADTGRYQWVLRDVLSGSVEARGTGRYFDYTATEYGREKTLALFNPAGQKDDSLRFAIHCPTPPLMPEWALPEIPEQPNKPYRFGIRPHGADTLAKWVFNGLDTIAGFSATYTFTAGNTAEVACILYVGAFCFSVETREYTIQQNKPLLALEPLFPDTSPPALAKNTPKPWAWLLALLPLAVSFWLLYRWWRQGPQKPVIKPLETLLQEYPIHDKAPYFIPYLPPDGRISTPADFFRMAEVLRRREEGEHRELDIPGSVQATVEGGGYPVLREKRNTTPPDYLFLVERSSAQDQQGRLFERLATFFQKQDTPVSAFYHDGSFRSFWNDGHPDGVGFSYLHKQYENCRLVLIGTGHGLYDTRNREEPALQRPLLSALLHWKKALFLSTLPVSGWYAQEVLLHRHFLLYPADTEGLLAGLEALDALEQYEPVPYRSWERTLAARRTDRNPRFELWDSAEAHREFLQPDGEAFRWLCALAVSVAPDFALTVAIGRKLGLDVTHDRLLLLSRIPWLSQNEPDTQLRLELLKCLTAEEERLAREAVAEELEAVRQSVEGSFAQLEWKTNLAVHRFALDPQNPGHRQLLQDLLEAGLLSGSQIKDLDALVQRRLKVPGTTMPGYGIQEYLAEPAPRRFFRKPMPLALAFAALSLAIFAALLWQSSGTNRATANVGGILPDLLFDQKYAIAPEVELHNRAVDTALQLRNLSTYTEWALRDSSARIAEALFDSALAIRQPYLLAGRNRSALLYNQGASGYNFALQDSVRGEGEAAAIPFATDPLPERVLRSRRFQALAQAVGQFRSAMGGVNESDSISLAARHGMGLCYYYLDKEYQAVAPDSAVSAYQKLLSLTDGGYFEALKDTMPVNLETLLNGKPVVEPKEQLITLRGRIRDDRSGRVLVGATVRAGDASRLSAGALRSARVASFEGRSDARGRYTLEGVPATTGMLLVYVEAAGYQAQELRLRPQAEMPTIRLKLEVQPEPDDKDGKAWQEALALNTVVGYKRYKSSFPKGQYLQEADAKIFGLEAKAAFDAAVAANTLAAYNAFLQGPYGDSDLAGEARRRRDILQEAADYRAASTPEELRAFLDKWPNGANAAAAKKRLDAPTPVPDPLKKLEADMVRIAGGSFTRGCQDKKRDGECYDDEKPSRTVQVSVFSLGRYEVTQAQWRAVMGSDPPELYFKNCDNCPVENVSWDDIQEFLQKLNALTGKKYRLPSEAEWEYAARGGSQSRGYLYSGSNNADEVAWYDDNSDSKTHPVGGKKPNELGLYDMSGNVWEWCEDDYHDTYQNAPTDSRPWVDRPRGGSRVLRGGSWLNVTRYLRAAFRVRFDPEDRGDVVGFRLARD